MDDKPIIITSFRDDSIAAVSDLQIGDAIIVGIHTSGANGKGN